MIAFWALLPKKPKVKGHIRPWPIWKLLLWKLFFEFLIIEINYFWRETSGLENRIDCRPNHSYFLRLYKKLHSYCCLDLRRTRVIDLNPWVKYCLKKDNKNLFVKSTRLINSKFESYLTCESGCRQTYCIFIQEKNYKINCLHSSVLNC